MGSSNSRPTRAKVSRRRHITLPKETETTNVSEENRQLTKVAKMIYDGIPEGGCYLMDLPPLLRRDVKNTLNYIHALNRLGYVIIKETEGTRRRWVMRKNETSKRPEKVLPRALWDTLQIVYNINEIDTAILRQHMPSNITWLRDILYRLEARNLIVLDRIEKSRRIYTITDKGRKMAESGQCDRQ